MLCSGDLDDLSTSEILLNYESPFLLATKTQQNVSHVSDKATKVRFSWQQLLIKLTTNEAVVHDKHGVWMHSNICVLSCSVLESDPEFGFEEAKRQLEGLFIFYFFFFSLIDSF